MILNRIEILTPFPVNSSGEPDLKRRGLLKLGLLVASLGVGALANPGILHAESDTPEGPSIATPTPGVSNKQRVEQMYGVTFGRWSDYHDPNGEECVLGSQDDPLPVDTLPGLNQCKDIPLELDEGRILAAEKAFQVLPGYWYERAIMVPSIDPLRSFVEFDNWNVVNLLLRDFTPDSPGSPPLLAHELVHRLTFKTIRKIGWEDKTLPSGKTAKTAELVECDQFDQVYQILGGGFKKPPENLTRIADRIVEELKGVTTQEKENGGFNTLRGGILYFTRRNYPVEVGPVLVEGILRPVFDPAAPQDYFMRSYTAYFGEEIAGKLYQHAIDYFFRGQAPQAPVINRP